MTLTCFLLIWKSHICIVPRAMLLKAHKLRGENLKTYNIRSFMF